MFALSFGVDAGVVVAVVAVVGNVSVIVVAVAVVAVVVAGCGPSPHVGVHNLGVASTWGYDFRGISGSRFLGGGGRRGGTWIPVWAASRAKG